MAVANTICLAIIAAVQLWSAADWVHNYVQRRRALQRAERFWRPLRDAMEEHAEQQRQGVN